MLAASTLDAMLMLMATIPQPPRCCLTFDISPMLVRHVALFDARWLPITPRTRFRAAATVACRDADSRPWLPPC